jgi:hypothetical protein
LFFMDACGLFSILQVVVRPVMGAAMYLGRANSVPVRRDCHRSLNLCGVGVHTRGACYPYALAIFGDLSNQVTQFGGRANFL